MGRSVRDVLLIFTFTFLLPISNAAWNGTCYSVDYPLLYDITNFGSADSGMTLSRWAAILTPTGSIEDTPLILTNGTAANAGAVSGTGPRTENELAFGQAYTTNPVTFPSDFSFSTYFEFQITNNVGTIVDTDGVIGADGILFIIQANSDDPNPALYNDDGGYFFLAFADMDKSFAVEIDTFQDTNVDDPNGNHIGIDTGGNLQSVATQDISVTLNNGQPWYMWIDYIGYNTTIYIYLSSTSAVRPASPTLTFTTGIEGILGTYTNYVGFGGAVGADGDTHMINDWKFLTGYHPIIVQCNPGQVINGSTCSQCPTGYYNPDVNGYCCQPCNCVYGNCDQYYGNCSSCHGNYSGSDCNECLPVSFCLFIS